jgi:hypothetical protein
MWSFMVLVVINNLEQVDDVAIRVFEDLETQAILLVQSNAELSGAVAAELLGLQTFDRVKDAFVLGGFNDCHDVLESTVDTFGE